MKYFQISILFLILSSCSLSITKNWKEATIEKEFIENKYFSNVNIDYIYKAKIEIYKRNFGGILIIKKIGEQEYRVVFTTEFGNKLFDFNYQKDRFRVEYILEELNKKVIVNTLQKDFKLLIVEKEKVLVQYKTEKDIIYKTERDKHFNFYFFNKKTSNLDKLISATKSKEKVEINFSKIENSLANIISVKHKNIPLTLELEKFANQ